jgi:hypothetical protein
MTDCDQGPQRLRTNQRRIAHQDEDIAAKSREGAPCLLHRVRGSPTVALDGSDDLELGRCVTRRLLDLRRSGTDHDHHAIGAQSRHFAQDMPDQRPPGDPVHDLGSGGTHSRSKTGRQDDDG